MANPNHAQGGHWYALNGEPRHFQQKKDGTGLTPTTIAHAKKLNDGINTILPSVTTVCGIMDKPALVAWKVRNGIMAALTTPKNEGESMDDFADRVLTQDSESISDAAKQLGTDVHAAIEDALKNGDTKACPPELLPFVEPVLAEVAKFGSQYTTERSMVGIGYAGRCDLVVDGGEQIVVVDFKTTSAAKLPKKSYDEHRWQLAAYAKCVGNTECKRIITANIYISTMRPGEIAVCINEELAQDFEVFQSILTCWQKIKGFVPKQ